VRLGAVALAALEMKRVPVAVIPTGALLQTGGEPAVWVVSLREKLVHRRTVKVLRVRRRVSNDFRGLKKAIS